MPQKQYKYNKRDLKLLFKRELEFEDFRKLTHFVFISKRWGEQIPGTYTVYHMCDDGVAIATNALCINEWLKANGLPVRRPINEYTAEQKISINSGHNIDNRTDQSISMRNKTGKKPKHCSNLYVDDLSLDVWNWYTAGLTVAEISRRINCTPPNVYYHLNKYKKANPEWESELTQVDN